MRFIAGSVLLASLLATASAAAQSALERSALLGDDWIGFPWAAEISLLSVYGNPAGRNLDADPAVQAALGLPGNALIGVHFTPEPLGASGVGPATVEGFARLRVLSQDGGSPLDLTAEGIVATADGAWAATARGTAGRWLGPVRVTGMAELDPMDPAEVAVGAGATWHFLRGRAPLALAADVAAVPWSDLEHDVAWSAGLQVGLSFTTHTLSLFATNAHTTRRGQRVGSGETRLGIEVTAPIPLGRFFGAYAPRERAVEAVTPREARPVGNAAERVVVVPIRDYRYAPQRLVVEAGTIVEWVNEDEVMHTATADDAAWNSGAIPPGERWRASFDGPGTYPYHCGPHPFMRGVVVVR